MYFLLYGFIYQKNVVILEPILQLINMKRPPFLLILIKWVLISPLAASAHVVFSNYMVADGLSDNNVLCGLRDRYGFMWLGTNNGLNCFDGIQNTIYRNYTKQHHHRTP